jgi:NhaA family Na+:H+ antiporter
VVVVAVVAALIWANGPWRHSYHDVWSWRVPLGLDRLHLRWTLEEWVNDSFMSVFFFVVGVEIKRELTTGHLRDRRAALLPALAALGGMAIPALLFRFVSDPAHDHGWGIPMATDIALAVGMVALLGDRLPRSMRVFLLALAVADDIGAIVVIAVFYGGSTRWGWLAGAVATVAVAAFAVNRRVRWTPLYFVLAIVGWYFLVRSGVHPTLMGVAFGLIAPVGALEQLEHTWHPWSSFVIVPVFALANAGVELGFHAARSAVTSRLGIGIIVGLVVGKVIGITGVTYLVVRLGWSRLPDGATWRSVIGVALFGGIGFTVALFVSVLALPGYDSLEAAKLAVLIASCLAALGGAAVLSGSRNSIDAG